MPSSNCRSSWIVHVAILAAGIESASADSITLLNRTVHQGTIVEESSDALTLEVVVAGETFRYKFGKHEILEWSRSTNVEPAARLTEPVPVSPIAVPATPPVPSSQDDGSSPIEIEGWLESKTDGVVCAGVLEATIRFSMPPDGTWLVSSGECERVAERAGRLPKRAYWEGEVSLVAPRVGGHQVRQPSSVQIAAARRELESKCRKEIRSRLFEQKTADGSFPIYLVTNDDKIRSLQLAVVTQPGTPESIIFGEGGSFRVAGTGEWVERKDVSMADINRLAFAPRYRELLAKSLEIAARVETGLQECREAGRAVPILCSHCDGDGTHSGRDAGAFSVAERMEWDRRVSTLASMQTGTGFSRAVITVSCSECAGSGKVGERDPTPEFRAAAIRRIRLLEEFAESTRSTMERFRRILAGLESGVERSGEELDRALNETAREGVANAAILSRLQASDEELRRTPR